MKPYHLPPTTNTIEMAQIAEFNTRLEAHQGPALTAAELEGAPLHRRSTGVLPGTVGRIGTVATTPEPGPAPAHRSRYWHLVRTTL